MVICASRKLYFVQANIFTQKVSRKQSATNLSILTQVFASRSCLPQARGLFLFLEGTKLLDTIGPAVAFSA